MSVQITYLRQLDLFVTGFESSQALLLFGTTLRVPVPLLRIPCEQRFPCIKSLVFDGCWRNDSKSFLLLFVSSCLVGLLHLFSLYHYVSLLLSLIGGRWINTLQFASVFRLLLLSFFAVPFSSAVGCPRAASFCSTLLLLEGISGYG